MQRLTTIWLTGAFVVAVCCGVGGLALADVAGQPDTEPYLFWSTFGSLGSGNGQFSAPTGGAVAKNTGTIFVADRGNKRIQIFTQNMQFLFAFPVDAAGSGPSKLAVSAAGTYVGVVDEALPYFQVYNVNLANKTAALLFKAGSYGAGDGQFRMPRAIAVDPAGNYWYVADDMRVQKFGSLNGAFAGKFGGACACGNTACADPDGTGPLQPGDGQFNFIGGLAVAANGDVYVADTPVSSWQATVCASDPYGRPRIQVFGAATGAFKAKWKPSGTQKRITDVALDAADYIHVTSDYYGAAPAMLYRYAAGGALVAQLTASRTPELGHAVGLIVSPASGSITSLYLYSADADANRLVRWTGRDGVVDTGDNCKALFNPSQNDGDADGVGDLCDNCDAIANADQKDTDSDKLGDLCDADLDGDGFANESDAFPLDKTEWADSDGDTHGDNSDVFPDNPNEWADTDGDKVGDNSDAFPTNANESADTDGDGLGDKADPDDDNDGVLDTGDNCPLAANKDQYDSGGWDLHIGDACEDADNDCPKDCDLTAGASFKPGGCAVACVDAADLCPDDPANDDPAKGGDGDMVCEGARADAAKGYKPADNSPLPNPDQANSDQGYSVAMLGSIGTGQGQFDNNSTYADRAALRGVAVDPRNGDILIAEGKDDADPAKRVNSIHRFDASGAIFKARFGTPLGGDTVTLATKGMRGVVSLAVDADGNIYTGNAAGNAIVKYSVDANYKPSFQYAICEGVKVTDVNDARLVNGCASSLNNATTGVRASTGYFGKGDLYDKNIGTGVRFVAVGGQDYYGEELLYATDWINDRIQVFKAATGLFMFGYCDQCTTVGSTTTCTPIKFTAATQSQCHIAPATTNFRALDNAAGIAVDADGIVAVTRAVPENSESTITILHPEGRIIRRFAFKSLSGSANWFIAAYAIAFDPAHNIYIAQPKAQVAPPAPRPAPDKTIQKYDFSGNLLNSFGPVVMNTGSDSDPGGSFEMGATATHHRVGVLGLAINKSENRLIVPDPGNSRFQQVVADNNGDKSDPCPTTSDSPEPGSEACTPPPP